MMEIGNAVFGNSRGEFPVERAGWIENKFFSLMELIGDEDGYGVDFENEVFFMMPYYWGECTCGWDYIDGGHEKTFMLKHSDDCYQHEYRKYDKCYGFSRPDKNHRRLKEIYKKYGFDTEADDWWHGCAIRCSCGYWERYENILDEYAKEFGHKGCTNECMLEKPNFLHKPSGLRVSWYKYPFRDSYSNVELTPELWKEVVEDCIRSVK